MKRAKPAARKILVSMNSIQWSTVSYILNSWIEENGTVLGLVVRPRLKNHKTLKSAIRAKNYLEKALKEKLK